MKKIVYLVMGTLVPALLFSQAKLVEKVVKKGDEIVIPYEKYVLPNGLTVILHEDHSDPVVHVDVTYHVGSAREEIGKSGFAHFFEHMMFEGSDNVPSKAHYKMVFGAGGDMNGTTNVDRTNYYQTVPNNQLERMLWLESDRMGYLVNAVTQQKFEIQRSTVKNERGERIDNAPYGLLPEMVAKTLYPYGHPYSWLTIGYVEDLDRVNVQDLKNFFLRWYGPNNATLSIGGDLDPKKTIKLIEKYFGSIPKGPAVTPTKLPPVVLPSNRYVSYVDNYARSPQLALVFPTVPDYHPDVVALAAFAQIFGQGRNSILYQNMVKNQKALQAGAFSSLSELAGVLYITAVPYPNGNLADMEKEIRSAFAEFEKNGVSDDAIAKFKAGIERTIFGRLSSVSGKVSALADYQTFTGNPNTTPRDLERYRKVTKEDVMRVFNKYIKDKPAVIASVLPKGKENLKAAADNFTASTGSDYKRPDYGYDKLKYAPNKDNFNRKIVPPAGSNPVVKVPAFWKQTLSNGIEVVGAENTEVPSIAMNIYLKGGRLVEANDLSKAGLTSMFATMMSEGTKMRSSEEITLALDKLGSAISFNTTTDAIVITVSSLKKNLGPTLDILKERLLSPEFKEDAFARIKRQLLENIKNGKTQAPTVADNVFARVNYGIKTLFGMPTRGTEETVANIKLDDIVKFYNNSISSDGAQVVIVGDVKQADVLPKLGFLNSLPKTPINIKAPLAPTPPQKPTLYFVNIPKAAQTEFRVGYVTNQTYDPLGDYFKSQLANYPIGAGPNARFFANLREEKGWTYGAYSGFSADKYTGRFQMSSAVRGNATDSAMGEILREFREYHEKGATAAEIQFMKTAIGESDARNYETGAQKAAFIYRILKYGLPLDYVSRQQKILDATTEQDIDMLAREYFDVNKMNFVLVGDKEKVLRSLEKYKIEIVELDADGNRIIEQ